MAPHTLAAIRVFADIYGILDPQDSIAFTLAVLDLPFALRELLGNRPEAKPGITLL